MTPVENKSDQTLPGIPLDTMVRDEQTDGNGRVDNITDWALANFREHYADDKISKDDIWSYIYGALHAPDWRAKYATELSKHLPRIVLALDFTAFRDAGAALMSLHLNFETIQPWELYVEIEGKAHRGAGLTDKTCKDPTVYRLAPKLRWGKLTNAKGSGLLTEDRSVLHVSKRCRILGIPAVSGNPYRGDDALTTPLDAAADDTAHLPPYIVNGKTPLEWAVAQLRSEPKRKTPGIVNDANKWHVWAADEDAHKLVLHLLRLVRVSVETAQIVDGLPPALTDE